MRSPFVATVAVAAVLWAPAIAHAATTKHHKMHHVTYHHAARAAYAMAPRPYMVAPVYDPCADENVNAVSIERCDRLTVNGF